MFRQLGRETKEAGEFAFAAGLMSTNRNCSVKTLGRETMDVLNINFEERILIALK